MRGPALLLGQIDKRLVGNRFHESVAKQAYFLLYADPSWVNQHTMTIPAGQADVRHAFTLAPGPYLGLITNGVIPPGPFTLYAVGSHQHLRGTRNRLDIQRASGAKECLLDIERWDFHWQGTYALKTTKRVEMSDSISLECHWDNSAANQPDRLPPRDLNWGEGTNDEMCLGLLYITQ